MPSANAQASLRGHSSPEGRTLQDYHSVIAQSVNDKAISKHAESMQSIFLQHFFRGKVPSADACRTVDNKSVMLNAVKHLRYNQAFDEILRDAQDDNNGE